LDIISIQTKYSTEKTNIVNSTLESKIEPCLGGSWELLIKSQSSPLRVLVVRDVGRLGRRLGLCVFGGQLSSVDRELVCIKHNLLSTLFNLEGNLDMALIAPFPTKLKIVDRDGVVCWFDAEGFYSARRDRRGVASDILRVWQNLPV